jgi:xanthine dehydrogenase accessory factor
MSRFDLLERAEALRLARTPYVLATVVRAQRPTSAKAGDSALVLADGTLDGFVGGTCAESTVRSVGLELLQSGASTLLRITPETAEDEAADGLLVVNNPCLSGGTLEIFMEPMLPAPLIHVFGDAPVARALVRVGEAIGYAMATGDRIAPDTTAVLIASHGHGEEPVLQAALRAEVPYIGLIASRRRGDSVLAALGQSRDRIHTPAGLDIGARTASEIAVSVFAEIISSRPVSTVETPPIAVDRRRGARAEPPGVQSGIDPVCGMTVEISPLSLYADHAGQRIYFCASGCKAAFLADPDRYLRAAS